MADLETTASPTDDRDAARLQVVLTDQPGGLRVAWRLAGVSLRAGQRLAALPRAIAGAPTVRLGAGAVTAHDDLGSIPLDVRTEAADGGPQQAWDAARDTAGTIEVTYLARPDSAEPLAATPPLELRREAGGLSGALKCFVVLPPEPEDLAFEVQWVGPSPDAVPGWTAVTSLGECSGRDDRVTGRGLELLGDTYVMCGDLTRRHHRDGQTSTWWLRRPGFDVVEFTDRLGRTYDLMSTAFEVPAHPYRVFLRSHPHRGANASAHPASFVMATNPDSPLAVSKIYETVAHELVHEWLHLDGPDVDVRWFGEGAADYYSLVLPARAGIVAEEEFLEAVNAEARTGYANPRRHLTMQEATPLFFDDFFAHWLPYARGMFYLADLDGRLTEATAGAASVDDVVRRVVRLQREGARVGVDEWCGLVDEALGGDERDALEAMVFSGTRTPGPATFGGRYLLGEAQAPLLDEVGFDVSTFLTRRVRGLVAGGPADLAGLEEGDTVDLPAYVEALALGPDDLTVGVTRGGRTHQVSIPLAGRTVPVPAWHAKGRAE